MNARRWIGAVLTLVTLLACAAEPRQSAWETQTTLIGDTTVVRTVGATDSAAALRLVAELSIGALEGPDELTFANVSAIVAAPGGGVYVWDGTLRALRQYDSTGAFVRQVGQRGDGPGEYQSMGGLAAMPGNRLALWDWRRGRINLYDVGSGAFLDSWRAPHQALSTNALHVDDSGDLALITYLEEWSPDRSAAARRQGVVRVSGRDGRVLDSLAAPPLPPPLVLSANFANAQQTGSVWFPLPFAPQPQWAWSPQGHFVSGTGDEYAVMVRHPDGGAPLRIEREVPALRASRAERENHTAVLTAGLSATDPAWRWHGPSVPETKAHFTAIRVDDDGRLWLRRSQPGVRRAVDEGAEAGAPPSAQPRLEWHEPTAYDVFSPAGRYLGFLPLADSVAILRMSGDLVWGVVRDSLDVPYVTRFRIEPSLTGRDQPPPGPGR